MEQTIKYGSPVKRFLRELGIRETKERFSRIADFCNPEDPNWESVLNKLCFDNGKENCLYRKALKNLDWDIFAQAIRNYPKHFICKVDLTSEGLNFNWKLRKIGRQRSRKQVVWILHEETCGNGVVVPIIYIRNGSDNTKEMGRIRMELKKVAKHPETLRKISVLELILHEKKVDIYNGLFGIARYDLENEKLNIDFYHVPNEHQCEDQYEIYVRGLGLLGKDKK